MTASRSDCGRPRVSVVIVHWNTPRALAATLASIAPGAGGVPCETIVVDNASHAEPPRAVDLCGARLVRNSSNRGFAAAANQGARLARGDLLLFLNSDARLHPGALRALVACVDGDPSIAAVAPVIVDRAGRRRSPAMRFLGPASHALGLLGIRHHRYPTADTPGGMQRADWVTGAVMLVRRSVFAAIGGFDEGFFFYEEDEDLCWRLRRRGHQVAVVGWAEAEHRGGESVARAASWPREQLYRGHVRFVRRRGGAGAAVLCRLCLTVVLLAKRAVRMFGRQASADSQVPLRVLWRSVP